MKKNKNEIIISIIVIFFAFITLFSYHKSKTIITATEIPFKENANVDYKVYLNNEKYYNKKYLEEGMQYISSIIDYIDVNFNYDAKYDGVEKYNISKKVTAKLDIVDSEENDKIIYTKTDILKDEKVENRLLKSNDNIKINYKKYNDLTNEFKSNYGISAKSNLQINYRISYVDEKNYVSKSKNMSVVIPLSEQMINITKTTPTQEDSIYYAETNKTSINTTLFIVSIIFLALTLISLFILVLCIINRRKKESKYERFIAKTLRQYDSFITNAKKEPSKKDKEIIKVNSFKELLDVRNSVEKAIVYTKVNEDKSKFQLIDDQIYEFEVTRKEMDE